MIFGNQKCLDVLLWSCGKIEFAGSDNILEVWLSIQQEHIEKKRKEKKKLLALLEKLDKKAEITSLSDQEVNFNHYLKERLILILREEEIKWYERAKVKTLLEGDDNTRFFHLVANGKHRKQHISKLENVQGIVIGDDQLKIHIT
jgi:mannosylglycoprotein endo-beta-mannosidase